MNRTVPFHSHALLVHAECPSCLSQPVPFAAESQIFVQPAQTVLEGTIAEVFKGTSESCFAKHSRLSPGNNYVKAN